MNSKIKHGGDIRRIFIQILKSLRLAFAIFFIIQVQARSSRKNKQNRSPANVHAVCSIQTVKFCTRLSRPFLIQSDSASRKRPFSTALFFDRNLLVLLLIVSRVDFVVFVLFLEAVGVREYCCTAVDIGWQLRASCFLREQRLNEPSSQRVSGFGPSRKPPKLRSWSCTQPRAAKAAAGAAVVGSMGSIPRAAAVV